MDWTDFAKVAIPALGAWLAAWLQNLRERRQWTAKHEAEQRNLLSAQADRLSAGWAEMTTQAREIITRLQVETIDAKTRAAVAEEKASNLERELAEVRRKYEAALAELDRLKERRPRSKGTGTGDRDDHEH